MIPQFARGSELGLCLLIHGGIVLTQAAEDSVEGDLPSSLAAVKFNHTSIADEQQSHNS